MSKAQQGWSHFTKVILGTGGGRGGLVTGPQAITMSGAVDLAMEATSGDTTVERNVLVVDPGGASRNLDLPPEADCEGLLLLIVNSADAAEFLTIRNDGNTKTVATIGQNEEAIVYCNGTVWYGAGLPATSSRRVAVGDAAYSILAANTGKPHLVANVSADRTFTFPAEADGLEFEFYAQVGVADGHDWIFDTGSDTNYFLGGVLHIDTDAIASSAMIPSDGNSNSKLQINLPQGGTWLKFVCDGTLWTVTGTVNSVTAPAFADQ